MQGLRVSHSAVTTTMVEKKSLTLKEYSWCEIIKHDKAGDCWIVIAGLVYDISKFVDVHPGYIFKYKFSGPMIYDGAGGDCTALWHSYHPSFMTSNPPP